MNNHKTSGALGGKSTLARHGHEHFSTIGKRGARSTWQRYKLVPVGTFGLAMVDRKTGEFKAFITCPIDQQLEEAINGQA
jgi:hypothetical protein